MCLEKVPCMVFYSSKILEWLLDDVGDSFQNPTLMQKNLPFIVYGTQVCAHMPMYAYACMKHAHTSLEHAHTHVCVHMP